MTDNKQIFLGGIPAKLDAKNVEGQTVERNGEAFYKIGNYDGMRPFFMSLVSNSNHWMFISSTGGLTAGRKNSNYALFPYYTDDKITESFETTGSKSLFLVEMDGRRMLWEPFSNRMRGLYATSRNLYKNTYGNKLLFEEINHDLGLAFSYEWNSSEAYGFVRKAELVNQNPQAVKVEVLDGIQNILPYGVEDALQNASSNLVDAYKKCELEKDAGLAIYSLSAIIVDRAEPSEALKANIVWSTGLDGAKVLLCSRQLDAFRGGFGLEEEIDIKAEKGAFFLNKEIEIAAGASERWAMVADVHQGPSQVAQTKALLADAAGLYTKVLADVEAGTAGLIKLVAASDGLQLTGDAILNKRHFANTMFNIMRGGIFDFNYTIEKVDFVPYMEKANFAIGQKFAGELAALPEVFDLFHLRALAANSSDADFQRLCTEYLPLKFSRRHGDPSRPWNKFSINTRNEEDGSKILDYQGNWRDIFQNWEALAHSYPEFIEGMIHKFLNASTFDGYNPYRVTKDGFDWETIEPDNPWSYIGYWGDHQIIYLLKFLEFIEKYYPEKLADLFSKELFVYANVPYRIKPYADLLANPKDTIVFDEEEHEAIEALREKIGVDGALLRNTGGNIHRVNFVEKILATVLAKVSNFIPEAGIWMNTQRPEWNDANNALVGNGVSMVTLYYLRRFLAFFENLVDGNTHEVQVSKEMADYFHGVKTALEQFEGLLSGAIGDVDRKKVTDMLGELAGAYRAKIYGEGFSGKKAALNVAEVKGFCQTAREHMEHSIRANKRADGLYHAYNLMTVEGEGIKVSYLSEMLEGQVAVLSAGYLSTEETLSVLDSLKASALFREDQYSYILYPNKELKRFVDKNVIPTERAEASELLKQLVAAGNRQVVNRDCNGVYHFNGTFNNVDSLRKALTELPEVYAELAAKEADLLATIFEEVFDHKSFTGRSGTFFGYEGLGSIYWHMVSKLLLASYETTQKAIDENADAALVGRMYDHFFEIVAGVGAHKSPKLYGAFPTDPYSHTPGGKGAQQPGMTGQVKEDLLSRFGELGVRVEGGKLRFEPTIMRAQEFLTEAKVFSYLNVEGEGEELALEAGSLAFTVCQVPVVYVKSDVAAMVVRTKEGDVKLAGTELDPHWSSKLFQRTGEIKSIEVHVVK
ncbi:MAG: hypothetical protein RL754_1295 [Bacteroidota bacterium]